MKSRKLLLSCFVVCHAVYFVEAQGTFQNLDFESVSFVPIPGDPYGRVQFDSALPSWIGYVGGVQQTAVLSNNAFLDSSGIGIVDSGWPHFGGTAGVIEGNYTVLLQAGVALGTFTPADTTLSQTSLIPLDAQSLQFRAYSWPFGSVTVLLGGETLSLTPLVTGNNYTLFGADVQGWQGQTARLDFTVIAQRPHMANINVFLDSIQFSDQAIPEPNTVVVLVFGALLLGWRFAIRR